jgi:hypothetical protein
MIYSHSWDLQTIPDQEKTMKIESKPTASAIHNLAIRYDKARAKRNAAQKALEKIEAECFALVDTYGFAVPQAEKSRRLTDGEDCDITVTYSDLTSIRGDKVKELAEALAASGKPELLTRFFTPRVSYEAIAEPVYTGIPVRLANRIRKMVAGCIYIKSKKPSLRVVIRDKKEKAA